MASWTNDELARIDAVDELRISTRRADGSLRSPVIVWAVRVSDDLYIRAVRGVSGLWYRHAMETGEGSISAGGVERDSTFTPVADADANRRIDAAFQQKYGRYAQSIVDSTLTDAAREATLKVTPA